MRRSFREMSPQCFSSEMRRESAASRPGTRREWPSALLSSRSAQRNARNNEGIAGPGQTRRLTRLTALRHFSGHQVSRARIRRPEAPAAPPWGCLTHRSPSSILISVHISNTPASPALHLLSRCCSPVAAQFGQRLTAEAARRLRGASELHMVVPDLGKLSSPILLKKSRNGTQRFRQL